MNFSELLKPMQKSSVRVKCDDNFNGECPVGRSKIGGKPDLPPDFQWFYFRGEDFNGVVDNRPLSFLAQINCAEVSGYDKDNLLPKKGMLYFFYDLATMTWGIYRSDRGSAKVYYCPGDISELRQTDFPADLPEELRLPEMPVTFSSESELPDFEEFTEWHDGVDYDKWQEYNKLKIEMGFASEQDGGETIHKLLGYANLVQGGMLAECERAAMADKARLENRTKWRLLFQLDSMQAQNYELMWGDGGRIYYYINADDLAKLNFDNCWLVLQCY